MMLFTMGSDRYAIAIMASFLLLSFLCFGIVLPSLVLGITVVPLSAWTSRSTNTSSTFGEHDTITCDVLVVGGGASGTFAAVRLREDFNKSVVVVERSERLGGHTDTYTDPVTHQPVDFGVQAWLDGPVVRNFTSKLNVTLAKVPSPQTQTQYIDFETGKPTPNFVPANEQEVGVALGKYFAILAAYPFLLQGYILPDPIPEELLIPFGDFVIKHDLQAAMQTIWQFANSVGDIVNTTTIYVIQTFGIPQLNAIFHDGFVIPASFAINEIYLKAAALLGPDVLYNTRLEHVFRCKDGDSGQHIIVQTPTGRKLIKANKILVTIPPTMENFAPFDLQDDERSLFNQWKYIQYWAGITRYGLPDGVTAINAQNNTTFNIPKLPAVERFGFTSLPRLHNFHAIGLESQSEVDVRALVLKTLAMMSTTSTFNTSAASIEVLANHSPLLVRVSAEAIKKGFYTRLNALQGVRGTYYTGNAWTGDYTSVVWDFTERLLPSIVAAIDGSATERQ